MTAPSIYEEGPAYWFGAWCLAARWEREVDEALAKWNLAHTRFMLLDIGEFLQRTTGDAFNQSELVEATRLSRASVSTAIRALEARDLVSRGPHGLDGRHLRLYVTAEGIQLLASTRPVVEALARRFHDAVALVG